MRENERGTEKEKPFFFPVEFVLMTIRFVRLVKNEKKNRSNNTIFTYSLFTIYVISFAVARTAESV